MELPQQSVLEIKHSSGKEILIPITDEVVKKVDRTAKTIEINAPEGLIDIYLD